MTSDTFKAPHERTRRRRYDKAFKRDLVEQTLAPGASVARIAREHGINANQLFKWRRQFLLAEQDTSAPPSLAEPPASLVPAAVVAEPARPDEAPAPTACTGMLEIRLAGGEVRIHGAIDPAMLRVVLSSLRR
jgi:transposase